MFPVPLCGLRQWYIRQVPLHGRAEDIRTLDLREVAALLDEPNLPRPVYRLYKIFLERGESMVDLDNLRKERIKVLKAELFMFLHDIGKLHVGHQAKYVRDKGKGKYIHTLLGPNNANRVNILPDDPFWFFRKKFSLKSIVKSHHSPSGYVTQVAQLVDWLDSEYDREWIPNTKYVRPFSWNLGCYKVFGFLPADRVLPLNVNIRNQPVNCDCHRDVLERLLCKLLNQVNPNLFADRKKRREFLYLGESAFSLTAGDTRFSVNEISLWDHSRSTSILFKLFWPYYTLVDQNLPNGDELKSSFREIFRPQLLPLRIDGLAYLAQSNNIPDLLARRALATQIYDALQDILEWEFPLAGEVYRDENGPVFLTFLRDKNGQDPIPLSALQLPEDSNDKHVLSQAYAHSKSLKDYLRQTIVELSQGDLTLPPEIPLFTYTQKLTKAEGEKSLGDLLADEQKQGLWLQADVATIQDTWEDTQEEVCPVCGLRPLGVRAKDSNSRRKAISRKMCGVCLERRVDRAKTWTQGVHKSSQERFWNDHPETVWLDEVADANGRLALIVGYFPLEHWLDGTLVESLAMFKQKANQRGYGVIPDGKVDRQIVLPGNRKPILGPKPVSYSRIRRIWETTRRFWQDIAPTDAPPKELRDFCNNNGLNLEDLWEGRLSLEESVAGKTIGEKRSRIFLKAANADELAKNENLGPFHAYEIEVQGRKVAVLWVPPEGEKVEDIPEEYRGGFWVIENLAYLEGLFGKPFVQVLQEGTQYEIHEPSEYGRPGRTATRFTLAEKNTDAPGYTPLIPILAEPRTFMALVPADKALDVVRAIKVKYEREMGKVRNRLPLHLGIIFADAHQPLRTIMDAGRRMLRSEFANGRISGWMVCPETFPEGPDSWATLRPTKQVPKQDRQALRHLIAKPRSLKKLTKHFDKWRRIVLKRWDRCFEETITWYVPAVMGDGVTQDWWYPFAFLEQEDEPKDRNIYYKATNPWNPAHPWLVHVSELRPGDVIYFTPATFDFIWLDHGGTRFEIAYKEQGQRRGSLRQPYLLDEMKDLIACWNLLQKYLSVNQIHQVRDLIENKRTEWFPEKGQPEDESGHKHKEDEGAQDKRSPENFRASINDATFKAYCQAVIHNAEWRHRKEVEPHLDRLTHWAITGLLADAVELFYHIMKQRPVGEEET